MSFALPWTPWSSFLVRWLDFRGDLDRLLQESFLEKYDFVVFMPLCSRIGTFGGLGVQVGATSSIKSRQRNAQGSQSGGRDSKKGAKSGQSGRTGSPQTAGLKRNADEAGGQIYLSDKSYD